MQHCVFLPYGSRQYPMLRIDSQRLPASEKCQDSTRCVGLTLYQMLSQEWLSSPSIQLESFQASFLSSQSTLSFRGSKFRARTRTLAPSQACHGIDLKNGSCRDIRSFPAATSMAQHFRIWRSSFVFGRTPAADVACFHLI